MKEINFNQSASRSSKVEVTVQIRDGNGNPTGKTKTYGADSCRDVSDWYNKQKTSKKKKRKKKKGS